MPTQLSAEDQQQLENLAGLLQQHASSKDQALATAMAFLKEKRRDYYWVGVYRLEDEATLVIGPYSGPQTEHVRIPVGTGVCGTAVAENQNQIVDDVRELTNYLACNLETRSEIVVLVRDPHSQKVLGQIDVDSTRIKNFDRAEEAFLERVAILIAKYF